MFKRLRNRLIWINLGVTSLVILAVFAAIYLFSINSASQRPPMPEGKIEIFSDDAENLVRVSLENEKRAAAQDLLVMLVAAGVALEVVVAIVSYFLAEEAIRPVREAYVSQKVFIANASHEIKTPLAAITANLEAADIHNNRWIENVEKEAAKLTELNTELLSLARTDLTKDTVVEEVDLSRLARECVKSFEPRMNNKKLIKKITTHGKVRTAPDDIRQILGILLDNAIKYSDSKIELRVTNHEIVVSNDGVTIPDKDLSSVFERFYQVDKNAEGVGLGLSIAKAVAERNNWTLSATSKDEKTSFCLKF